MADVSPVVPKSAAAEPEPYTPSTDDQAWISRVTDAFDRGRGIRRPHEPQWFVNHAFDRGNHYVVWSEGRGLSTPPAPQNRIRLTVNLIGAYNRSRAAKFLKARPVGLVIPATSDIDDRQNARFTTKALEYQSRRLRLEQKYSDALRTAQLMGHGYWWYHWDASLHARVKIKDPLTQQTTVEDAEAGDIVVEVDSPWSVLVADAAIPFVGDQPWIMRVRMRPLDYVRARFPDTGKYVAGEVGKDDALRYEDSVATLNAQGIGGQGLSENRETRSPSGKEGEKPYVFVKEYFEKPCPDYPKGRYAVVANGILVKRQEELPYGFADMANPYPCSDFTDLPRVGQYWNTTVCEQLISPQKEYNLMRSKLAEHLRLLAHPKVLVARQHQIQHGAWTSEAGEVIEYFAVPNLPEPKPWNPPSIAADIWRAMELIRKEMADIAHIYPESEGQVGTASSGFQTNLLQEAVDAVHKPEVDAHGRVLEEAHYKIRRLMKAGYDIDRLLTVSGKDLEPEAFEFSSDNIDDYADLVMIAASALPALPSAKSQMILEYWKAGVYGPADDPASRQKVQSQLEMGTAEDLYSDARKDEQQARVENDRFLDGEPLPTPDFYENHDQHYRVHTDLLKSPRRWDPNEKRELIAHVILHVKYQNPQSAIQLATQYGMPDLVADLTQVVPQGGQPAPGGGAPSGPPPPQAPPPNLPPGGVAPGGAGPAMMAPAPTDPSMQMPPPPMMGSGPGLPPEGGLPQ